MSGDKSPGYIKTPSKGASAIAPPRCHATLSIEKGRESRDIVPDTPKPSIGVPAVRPEVDTVRAAKVPGAAVPGPAANHHRHITAFQPCRAVSRRTLVGVVPPIPYPLPDVTGLVVQPETVCPVQTYRSSTTFPVERGTFGGTWLADRFIVTPRILETILSAAGCILPLGLGRQPSLQLETNLLSIDDVYWFPVQGCRKVPPQLQCLECLLAQTEL
jgi:hypothetical protein